MGVTVKAKPFATTADFIVYDNNVLRREDGKRICEFRFRAERNRCCQHSVDFAERNPTWKTYTTRVTRGSMNGRVG